jgi:hypothetical protein
VVRLLMFCLSATLWPHSPARAADAAPNQQAARDRQRALLNDLNAINGRWNSSRPGSQQALADAQTLTAGYGDLAHLGSADSALDRQIAGLAFAWLARASATYAADPVVAAALLGSYGVMGDFFARNTRFYRPGAVLAYSGANRLARALVLNRQTNGGFEGDLTRYGLAWAQALYLAGGNPPPATEDAIPPFATGPEAQAPELRAVPLPQIDEGKLTGEDKALWGEVGARFVPTAKRVLDARLSLEELSQRLRQQNLQVNQLDAATALIMQGFLEDAAGLIAAGQFQPALDALSRVDYQRAKLNNVIGR